MAPRKRSAAAAAVTEPSSPVDADNNDTNDEGATPSQPIQFSQTAPDRSQAIDPPRQSERDKLSGINPAVLEKIISDLSRLLLFKGLNGDTIDRLKVVKEALGDFNDCRIPNAVLDEAASRLRDVFGFAVRKVPGNMEQDLPPRFKDRLYLINEVEDDGAGTHSINVHSVHREETVERGLLMMCLAFAFCKGNPSRSGSMKGAGKTTRWITEHQLYGLLHRCDENVPAEPPSQEGRKNGAAAAGAIGRGPHRSSLVGGAVDATPDIDCSLERFVRADYLLRDKIEASEGGEVESESQGDANGKVVAYAMGPRAAMEIGRRQIVMFCSQVLDEQPDPTMLAEIDEEDEEEEAEVEEEEDEQIEVKPDPEPERTTKKRSGKKAKRER